MPELIFKEADKYAHVAVAVSGGADSMALVHMMSAYAQTRIRSLHIHALTVDHALRAESRAEAAKVAHWLSDMPHVTHQILRWDCPKPVAGLMEAARAARYRLMINECRSRGVAMLAVAHHGDDQAETFLMRLARGSGLDGLAAMRTLHSYDEQVTLWRPLLGMSHDDLIAYCCKHGLQWVADPTNQNQKYTRSRLRDAKGVLEAEGLSAKRLNATARRLDRASDALRILAERLLQRALIEKTPDSWTLSLPVLKAEPMELAVRVMRRALEVLGSQSGYGARFEKVEDIAYACLENDRPYTTTLGGCILRLNQRHETLEIMRETAAKRGKTLPSGTNGL